MMIAERNLSLGNGSNGGWHHRYVRICTSRFMDLRFPDNRLSTGAPEKAEKAMPLMNAVQAVINNHSETFPATGKLCDILLKGI
jgi:hypothetical protein